MLNRMQDASQYTTQVKKKEKGKLVLSVADEGDIESSSDRFGYQNNQNPGFCNESSSRDCYDELRKVISESLGRQNLLANGSVKAKPCFDKRGTEVYIDLPSANSSRTSTKYSYDSASVSSSSSNISEDRPKASNLIAKLMGLEEISPMALQSESRKQLERDKNLIPKGLIFDIDMLKRRKPWLAAQNGDRECMTLEEIIQNMQLKGLLNRDQFQIYDTLTSESENRFRNHAPPVVLMKPVHAGARANDLFSHKFIPTEESTSNKGMLHLYLQKSRIEKITETNAAKPNKKSLQKSADNKVKLTNSVGPGLQKDMIDKKVDKLQKSTSRRKSVEKETVRSTGLSKHCEQPKSVSRSHEHLSPPAMKMRKSEIGPSIDNKNLTTKQKSTKLKPINEALATNVQSIVHKDDTDQRKKADSSTDTTPAPQLIAEQELDDSEILIKDIYVDSPNPHCKDTMVTTQHESDHTSCAEEATKSINHHPPESTPYETTTVSSTTLSRSLSFLTHVEDLFDNIDTYQPMVLQILTGFHDHDSTNSKLLMDCANELLESRSQRNIPSIHPLIQRPLENPSFCISTDHLLQEVHNGIQSLMSYKNRAGETIPTNVVVSALLGKDLCCIGRSVEAWDVGWRNEFTGDEVQKIACDLDKLILGELVAEVLAEF